MLINVRHEERVSRIVACDPSRIPHDGRSVTTYMDSALKHEGLVSLILPKKGLLDV